MSEALNKFVKTLKTDWVEMPKYKLVLSAEADQDLDRLYVDGYTQWGESQADKYYDALLEHFTKLTESPLLFRAVDEIRKEYRRSVCGKHSIYYQIKIAL